MRVNDRDVGVLRKRPLARQRLVEHAAERVDVGRHADLVPLDLLRRRVVDSPDEEPLLCHLRSRELRDTEVRQEGAPARLVDEDVRRLDVAMHDLTRVRGVERSRRLSDDLECALGGELRLARDQRLQVVAFDVAHCDEEDAVDLARVVDRDHVRVLDRGDEL